MEPGTVLVYTVEHVLIISLANLVQCGVQPLPSLTRFPFLFGKNKPTAAYTGSWILMPNQDV